MSLKEILKAQGLSDEQIAAVLNAMKENKIFTASEENLDTRYGKLKTEHEGVSKQLSEAQGLIEQLKKGTGDNEVLQQKITDYETTVNTLKAENEKLKVEGALKVALLDAGAKASDLDYLMFKTQNSNREIKIGDDGKLKGQEELIAGLKTQFPANFTAPQKKEVQEHRLENGEDSTCTEEPKSLAEALKMEYEEKH